MRLTVGPLPPAVYWRRRALVLGAVLVLVLLIVYSCGNDSGANSTSTTGKSSQSPVVYPSEDNSTDAPPTDGGGPSLPKHGASGSPGSDPVGGSEADAPACADSDIKVVPKPERRRTREAARLRIDLEITNTSDRACKADVGADRQEVRVMRGKTRVWSSDDCQPRTGSHVEVLSPGEPVRRFWVTWDGRTSAPKCEGDRKVAREGDYQVVARLGKVTSSPVDIEVVNR